MYESTAAGPAEPSGGPATAVVRAAIGAAGSDAGEPAARAVGVLIVSLVATGSGPEMAQLLSPRPGSRAGFEVVRRPPVDGVAGQPPRPHTGVDLAGALAELRNPAGGSPEAALVSVAGDLRRRVLERSSDGAVSFVYPAVSAFEGDADACRQAAQAWSDWLTSAPARAVPGGAETSDAAFIERPEAVAALVKEALTDFTVEVDTKAVEDAVKRVLGDVVVEVDVQAIETAVRQVTAETEDAVRAQIGQAIDAAVDRATADVIRRADIPAVQSAITETLADLPRKTDLASVENTVKAGHADFTHRAKLIEDAARSALADLASKEDIATVAGAIRDALADIVRKVETSAVDAVKATQSDSAQRSDIEALAGAVDTLHGELKTVDAELAALRRQVADIPPPLPAPAPIDADRLADRTAELVAGHLEARLPEPDTDPASAAIVAQAALMSAAEQLQIQLEAFNDRIRAGSRSIEALADELSARERSASAFHEQLAASVEASLTRLADRIDQRFSDAAATGLDPAMVSEVRELAKAVRSLVRKANVTSVKASAAS